MRKLVTIRNIDEMLPHPNADKLELAMIGGWQCIVKKDEYKPGDMIVFFEIDSLLPIKPEFEFLRQYSYVKKDWLKSELNPEGEGFRLRTIKLRGSISQGLIITPPENFAELYWSLNDEQFSEFCELDHSEFFGVIKYDPPENGLSCRMGGQPRGSFPYFIRKTDQERVQNISFKQFEETHRLAETFEVTQKMDGSSLTCFYLHENSKFADEKYNGLGVCSRNVYLKLDIPEEEQSQFIKSVYEHNLNVAIELTAKELGIDLAVQGELVGEGIQDNLHNIKGHEIHVFDIFDISNQKYFLPDERISIFEILKRNGFTGHHVNVIVGDHPISWFWLDLEFRDPDTWVDDLNVIKRLNQIKSGELTPTPEILSHIRNRILKMAEFDLLHDKPNEGLVFKSTQREFSFKAVSNEYLIYRG